MASTVYLLCGLMSVVCFLLLLRGYWLTRTPLLLHSSICFACFAVNNVLLYVDLVLTAGFDLSFFGVAIPVWRTAISLGGVLVLLYGMLWERA